MSDTYNRTGVESGMSGLMKMGTLVLFMVSSGGSGNHQMANNRPDQ